MSDPKNLEELRAEASEVCEELSNLSAIENPNPGQVERLTRCMVRAERLQAQILDLEAGDPRHAEAKRAERDARKAELQPLMDKPGHVMPGSPSGPAFHRSREIYDEPITPGTAKHALEYRARSALDAMPDTIDREKIERLVKTKEGRADAEYTIVASDPNYTAAFVKMLKDPTYGHLGLEPEEQRAFAAAHRSEVRTALSTSGSAGGYLIPFHLDPNVIVTNTGTTNPFRAIARVETLVNSNVWHGVSSAGVTGEWVAEAAEFTDASPTFAQPTITPAKADAYVEASWEVVEDAVNLETQLAVLFRDAKDRLESTAFAVGTGTNQPKGIITELQLVTASRVSAQTNAAFGPIDLFAMSNALPARHQPNASWVAHRFMYNLVRQMPGTNMVPFWVDMGGATPGQLLGYNAYESSAILNAGGAASLSTATASSDDLLVLGDFSVAYCVVDRIGETIIVDPMVRGTNRRPTGTSSFTYYWRVGGGTLNRDAARLLRI